MKERGTVTILDVVLFPLAFVGGIVLLGVVLVSEFRAWLRRRLAR